jgi:hypothetical protein
MSGINYSPIGRPFIISAVLLSFFGVSIGSLWMFSLLGIRIAEVSDLFQIHETVQTEGFLTLMIMGVSYMIIPRFRNTALPSNKLAVLSFVLVLASLILELAQKVNGSESFAYSELIRLGGIMIFAAMIIYTIRITPKLLREADYFFIMSITMLALVHILPLITAAEVNTLNYIQVWLMFPTLMIFGVKYKTLPSFLGFIRPRRNVTVACLAAAAVGCALGIASMYYDDAGILVAFNAVMILTALLFAVSSYIYGGFDNSEILKLMPGEKKARYDMILRHTRIAFSFLIAGFTMGIMFYLYNGFLFYDLAIHYTAIGFIGITIMLFLPLMLPPIIGKSIEFLKFSRVPLLLILAALGLRTAGDYIIEKSVHSDLTVVFATSGLLVLAGMLWFIVMIHKSMSEIPSVNVEFKKK